MQIRLLRYFVVLAREGHFGKAAEMCSVTQPTLSAGLAALERNLGCQLVVRDRRFIDLSQAGKAILPWAQQLLAAFDGISHAVETASGPLRGEFRLGAIPAAMPVSGHVTGALLSEYPDLTVSVHSLTSREIEAKLVSFELDAGLTYLDHEPPAGVLAVPLYSERYVYVVHRSSPLANQESATWSDILAAPLCVLHQGMQNRRILDAGLAERGLALAPIALADSYLALLAMVQSGHCATIMPDSYVALFPDLEWARVLPLAEPLPPSRIGLIILRRDLLGPLASAALTVARHVNLPSPFQRA